MSKLSKYVDSLSTEELAKLIHNRVTAKQTGRELLSWDELKISTKEEYKQYMENLQEALKTLVLEPFKLAVELYATNQTTNQNSNVFYKGEELIPCYFCNMLATELKFKDPPTCETCASNG
jgi:uncharacterized lipoprotein YehR (DUF1307 family)